MVEYLVLVMLTFMDGSYAQYNDGNWDVVGAEDANEAYNKCQARIGEIQQEMKEAFTGHDPAPSTFLSGCIQKGQEPE